MRETVKEFKDEWIETNGKTDELEVVIADSKIDSSYIYEGSFVNIPIELEDKSVIDYAKIINSTVPERIGAYSLTI